MLEDCKYRELLEENRKLRESVIHLREYDPVTNLYNREAFCASAERTIRQTPQTRFEIICIDIERFKLINELYGREQGDLLLKYVAEQLKCLVREETHIAGNLRDDVFALCIPAYEEEVTVERILRIFSDKPLNSQAVPAVGVYRMDAEEPAAGSMCDRALMALNSIKGNDHHVAVYREGMRENLLREQEITNSMVAGIQNKEFKIYMQPKCNMETGKVVGAEVLVRWQHPEKGLLLPGEFVPLFEKNHFIEKLDLYVWEETAAWVRRWLDRGRACVPVSVNLSRMDIFNMDVCSVLTDLMERYQIPTGLIELEITESVYAGQPERIIKETERLKKSGFTILMDDFGNGYSSLNMLSSTNIDILKMDMRFMEGEGLKSLGILDAILHMSKWLNLPVIAEGVNREQHVKTLRSVGCVYGQGFYYYRPMNTEEFEHLLLTPGKVDFADGGRKKVGSGHFLDLTDLFHKDTLTDRLLGNITGAVAQYSYDGTRLCVLRANGEYYRLMDEYWMNKSGHVDVMRDILPEDREKMTDALSRAKESKEKEGAEVFVRKRRGNTVLWLRIRFFCLTSQYGNDIFYAALSDETVRMNSIESLRISEERFRLAMEATNTVIFELDTETRTAYYSEYAQKAFGLDATVANAPEGFIEQGTVCEGYEETFREIYRAIYRGEDKASCVVRAKMGDGSTVLNRITLTAIRDKEGRTVKAVGMVENVSCSEVEDEEK